MEKDNSLLYACWLNDITLIKERLEGVKPTQLKKTTQETGTPLHLAALNGNFEAVDLLIAAGADLEQGNFLGDNAMLACIEQGNLLMAKHLIEKGSDINKKGCQNRNALNQLIFYSWNEDFAQYLINKGCLINATARDGESLLQSAAVNNNTQAIQFLLSQGIDKAFLDKSLCWSIIYNLVDATGCLLNNGANLENMYLACKGIEKSLYHDTVSAGNRGSRQEMIKLLHDEGVDFKKAPARPISTYLEKTKLSPYDYAKERLSKFPQLTFIQDNIDLIDRLLSDKA